MDPFNQTFMLHDSQNHSIPVWVPSVDKVLLSATSKAINYGSQIGACAVMMVVVLTMTSRTRFGRASTIINLSGLVVGVLRCTLISLYYTSSYREFYAYFTDDFSRVLSNDTRISAVASFLAAPQLIIIEAALLLQAYALVKMWPASWKAGLLVLSGLVAVPAVVFSIFTVVIYMRSTLGFWVPESYVWLQECNLAFSTATIFWFCFVFISRLVIHMWSYRSVLPPLGRLSAMEVLVMTNGVLMLIPVVFAAMEFGEYTNFESGSLTLTSVVVVLPLGTVIAQNMNNGSGSRAPGYSGSGQASGGNNSHMYSGYSRASDMGNSRKGLFGSLSHASDSTGLVSGGPSRQVHIQGGSTVSGSRGLGKDKACADAVDQELQRIDASDDGICVVNGVWVSREIEVRGASEVV